MYKNIALIALLLPFSGYANTKQERRQEILCELNKIETRALWISEVVKHNYWVIYLCKDSFREEARELHTRAVALDAELKAIELELLQETTCTKK